MDLKTVVECKIIELQKCGKSQLTIEIQQLMVIFFKISFDSPSMYTELQVSSGNVKQFDVKSPAGNYTLVF